MLSKKGTALRRCYHFANKLSQAQLDKANYQSLFTSKGFEVLLPELAATSAPATFELIKKHPDALGVYNYMTPFNVAAALSGINMYWVVQARFAEKERLFEFDVMDTSGIFKSYVNLEYLVPTTYEDFISLFVLTTPFMDLVDIDMIFKHSKTNEIYLFDRAGSWNPEVANSPQLDFRRVFDEIEWIDNQIDNDK